MSGNKKTSDNEAKKWAGRVAEGAQCGKAMQQRFRLIPSKHLNNATKAGIRDMSLGKIKNGQPVGSPIIRFDNPHRGTDFHHINIDPKGFPSRYNPHIEVSEGVIKGAQVANKTLKYAGRGLLVVSIAADTWRIGSALSDDVEIQKNGYTMLEELEGILNELKNLLRDQPDAEERRTITKAIANVERRIKEIERILKTDIPCGTIKTVASVAGGWGGGAAGGAAGAWAGTQTGAAIGALFGPVGAVVGAPIGAVVGAIAGGIGAGIAGSAAGEAVTETMYEEFIDK